MRNLGMIRMKFIHRIIFSFTHIRRVRLTMVVIHLLVIGGSILLNKLLNERIRTCRIIRRVGEGNDVLVRADWEAFYITDLVDVLLGQFSLLHVLILLTLYDDTQFAFILAFCIESDDVIELLAEIILTERLQLFELFH